MNVPTRILLSRLAVAAVAAWVGGVSTSAAIAAEPPKVLVLGDHVLSNAAQTVGRDLKGRATVTLAKEPPGSTGEALSRLDTLVPQGRWDVIVFNFGLADLRHRDPSTKEVRSMSRAAGGMRTTSPTDYEKNLRTLVKHFQATGARVLWVHTTPIPSSKFDNLFEPGSAEEYNSIAAKIMTEQKVPIVDLHSFVSAKRPLDKQGRPASDPFNFKDVPIHELIMEALVRELKLPAAK